jgi:hypothetical protein
MFAYLLDAVRMAHGKLIAILADPAARVFPRCLNKKYGIGIGLSH